MPNPNADTPKNRLLAGLPARAYQKLAPSLERVPLEFKQVLLDQGAPVDYVYFVECGVCSVLRLTPDESPIEIATIGKEGMVGLPLLLGDEVSAEEVMCQVPGEALRLGASAFVSQVDQNPDLRRLCLRYTHALLGQVAQGTACNRIHDVEERAARWLLLTHDRVEGDEFPLTQEFLAQMLGVRRQAVNVAAGMLQQAGLISYVRGVVRILDRKGLEEASCECYAVIRADFARLIGWERTR